MNIGIYYGSTYGNTEKAAQDIATHLTEKAGATVHVLDVSRKDFSLVPGLDLVLLGCSTWHVGDLQDDWDSALKTFGGLDLRGKKVGLFGAGDQSTYADTFQDALGMLAELVEQQGGELIGFTSVEGYDHVESRGQRGDQFVGLALDDDNQQDLTAGRIDQWTTQILSELAVLA